MKFVFLHIQSSKEKWYEEASQAYVHKIKHFQSFEIVSLASKKLDRTDAAVKLRLESEMILDFLEPDDTLILFDEGGRNLKSEMFADLVQKQLNSGKKRCVWLIGGAFGVTEEVKARAQFKITLAPFVLNHQVAQIVALEQIYRAFTILRGMPYHNA